jgi:hypothetical protein
MSGGTGNATVMFENIVCLLTDFDEYLLISAEANFNGWLFSYNFSGTIRRNN